MIWDGQKAQGLRNQESGCLKTLMRGFGVLGFWGYCHNWLTYFFTNIFSKSTNASIRYSSCMSSEEAMKKFYKFFEKKI